MPDVRAPTDCKQCVTLVCGSSRFCLVTLLALAISSAVFWLCDSAIVVGMLAAFIAAMSIYYVSLFLLPQWLFLGTRVYAWLDQEDRLHVHKSSWWRGLACNNGEVQKRIPKSNVLSLWLGPWPGRSKVLGDKSPFWKVKVSGKWTFWPSPIRDLVFRDDTGYSVRIPLIKETTAGIAWDWDNLSLALQTMDYRQCLREVFLVARADQSSAPVVAGKVGTA